MVTARLGQCSLHHWSKRIICFVPRKEKILPVLMWSIVQCLEKRFHSNVFDLCSTSARMSSSSNNGETPTGRFDQSQFHPLFFSVHFSIFSVSLFEMWMMNNDLTIGRLMCFPSFSPIVNAGRLLSDEDSWASITTMIIWVWKQTSQLHSSCFNSIERWSISIVWISHPFLPLKWIDDGWAEDISIEIWQKIEQIDLECSIRWTSKLFDLSLPSGNTFLWWFFLLPFSHLRSSLTQLLIFSFTYFSWHRSMTNEWFDLRLDTTSGETCPKWSMDLLNQFKFKICSMMFVVLRGEETSLKERSRLLGVTVEWMCRFNSCKSIGIRCWSRSICCTFNVRSEPIRFARRSISLEIRLSREDCWMGHSTSNQPEHRQVEMSFRWGAREEDVPWWRTV